MLAASKVRIAKVVSALNAEDGGDINSSDDVVLQSSTFARNGLDGVAVATASFVKVTTSRIVGNGANGVTMDRVDDSAVTGSSITGNGGTGVVVDDNSRRNAVVGNRVLGNGVDGVFIESPTTIVTKNVADANRDQGFAIQDTVVDGGGNAARANSLIGACPPALACALPFLPKPGPVLPTCGMHVTSAIFTLQEPTDSPQRPG